MPIEPAPPLSDEAARRATRLNTPRLQREMATMAGMLRIYCRDHHPDAVHDAQGLCSECAELMTYAQKRLALCPFGPEKPTCANCQIHCYGRRQREQTRIVMRYAGPRMLLRHPILALAHLWVDSRRPAPPNPRIAQAVAEAAAPAPAGEQGQPPGIKSS